jgi:hypothetical protein
LSFFPLPRLAAFGGGKKNSFIHIENFFVKAFYGREKWAFQRRIKAHQTNRYCVGFGGVGGLGRVVMGSVRNDFINEQLWLTSK